MSVAKAGGKGEPQERKRVNLSLSEGGGGGIESVLADVATSGLEALLPRHALARFASALARRPDVALRRLGALSRELAVIAAGGYEPLDLDFRFADRTWRDNPMFNRLAAAYLAECRAIQGILDDVDLDKRTRAEMQLVVDNLIAALAPTNNPLTNPTCWKEALDTGGANLQAGIRNLLRDLATPTKLPTSVDRSAFVFGQTIAATPGKVVRRERLYELLEFAARTEKVDVVPTVMVASPVNKYYLMDLAPEDSIIGGHLDRGRRIFTPSWVNPDASHADAGFDAYVGAIIEAIETACEISGSDRVHLLGLCGGGQLALLAAGYLAAVGREDLLATLTIGIAIADFHGDDGEAAIDEHVGEAAIRRAAARGCFPAVDQAHNFAIIRPDEGIWSNFVRQYLLARKPPAVALIAWAVDQTNLATQFGADLIRLALSNGFVEGGLEILGQAIDTRKITVDTFVLGASDDHISPWRDCFRTIGLMGGDTTFVLAEGGHAIAVARPMGHPKAMHRIGPVTDGDPDVWLSRAARERGSWWNAWTTWIEEHAPEQRPAPERPGSQAFPPLDDAPGQYVRHVVT